MTPVKSSNISHVGYDSARNVLTVAFRGGSTYEYAGVSAIEHAALMGAASKGSHLNQQIKAKYKGVKVS